MKYITRNHKRLRIRGIEIAILAVIINIFFLPAYTPFEWSGNNTFTVFLNGVNVGMTATQEEVGDILKEARRKIAAASPELVFIDAEITIEGSEVLWGKVDDPAMVLNNMVDVLFDSRHQTMHRSYTVKINEFMVNLASKEEVLTLLRAAINQYDAEKKYDVELSLDAERELSVLTSEVLAKEEIKATEAEVVSTSAGIDLLVEEIFASVEPAVEKDFEDYDNGLIYINFGDTVEVVEAYLSKDELTDIDTAIAEITKEEEKSEIYEVVEGDTLSAISLKTNIPMEKIIEMNETLEDEKSIIRIGDGLVITVPEPEITIERQEERYIEEDYEEEIIYIDNDEWYTNQTKTLQEPSAGHRKVVALSSYRNNKEVSREIIKEEITYEAVPKIVERGTKIPPIYLKPLMGGRLSSGFGKRSAPTRGASTYHRGVDWATPVGTAITSSAAGTVAKAGWGSGYGYVVYVNHADGRQTRYAHLSKILVSTGQTVSQGQKIALSGNTGISSGPHLHFEILIGGSQVNPLKYLD